VLNFICGVEESGASFTACYRVNFMATSALELESTPGFRVQSRPIVLATDDELKILGL
jgi:hypothetical protein